MRGALALHRHDLPPAEDAMAHRLEDLIELLGGERLEEEVLQEGGAQPLLGALPSGRGECANLRGDELNPFGAALAPPEALGRALAKHLLAAHLGRGRRAGVGATRSHAHILHRCPALRRCAKPRPGAYRLWRDDDAGRAVVGAADRHAHGHRA